MKKKTRLKRGMYFGIFMMVFFLIQNLLINDDWTSRKVIIIVVSSLITGIVSTLFFAWIIGVFNKSKRMHDAIKIIVEPDERVLFHTPANHFKGVESVGGQLYLTNNRIIFKSHNFNIQKHQLSINLTEIKEFCRYKPLGLVNNGLYIITIQNKKEKFIIEEIENWLKYSVEQSNLQATVPKQEK